MCYNTEIGIQSLFCKDFEFSSCECCVKHFKLSLRIHFMYINVNCIFLIIIEDSEFGEFGGGNNTFYSVFLYT